MSNRFGNLSSAIILDSLSLVATLDTAARCARYMNLRRAGIDASSQESESDACRRVDESMRLLAEVALHLRLHCALNEVEAVAEADSIRRFETLLLLRKAAEGLRGLQQGLMSLYPSVNEAVVEDARLVHALFSEMLETGAIAEYRIDPLDALLRSVRETTM